MGSEEEEELIQSDGDEGSQRIQPQPTTLNPTILYRIRSNKSNPAVTMENRIFFRLVDTVLARHSSLKNKVIFLLKTKNCTK